MRIAWLAYGDLGQPTGGDIYDRLIVSKLRAAGDEVEVVDARGSGVWSGPRERSRLDAVVGDGLCVRELGPVFEGLDGASARVLLVHHFGSWELDCADRSEARAIEARAVGASDHLIVTGAATATRVAAEYRGWCIDVVPPGADRLPVQARAGGRRGGGIELLFVGSIIPRKRLALLLDAIQELADPRLTLTLVGDPDRDPVHARAIAARIAASPLLRACVFAAGVVDADALARTMARADLLVLPSSLEGYGMALAEALFAGLPVLASREAADAAGIGDGGAALIFDDVAGLQDALRRFVAEPRLRAALAEAAGRATLPRWNAAARDFRDVLIRVARDRSAGRAAPR